MQNGYYKALFLDLVLKSVEMHEADHHTPKTIFWVTTNVFVQITIFENPKYKIQCAEKYSLPQSNNAENIKSVIHVEEYKTENNAVFYGKGQ